MNWRWPLHSRRKQLKAERLETEAYAEKVHREVIRPLRDMRARNHLTDAVFAEIRRRAKESES